MTSKKSLGLAVALGLVLVAGIITVSIRADDDKRDRRHGRRHRAEMARSMPDLPRTLVAASSRRIILASARTGAIRSVVSTPRGYSPAIVTVTPDGQKLYASLKGRPCSSELLQVSGEDKDRLVPGEGPAVSADGRRLAFALPGVPCARSPKLVVLDLKTGDRRVWAPGMSDVRGSVPVAIRSLTWADDSTQLAFVLSYRHTGRGRAPDGRHTELRTLDTDADGGLLSSKVIEPPTEGAAYTLAAFRSGFGSLGALEVCCGREPSEFRVVSIDPESGEQLTPLLDPGADLRSMDFDNSGWHLLFVTGGKGRLFRWSGGEPTELGTGYLSAAW